MEDQAATKPSVDRVPHDAPGSREIGFSVPQQYNASAILFDNVDGVRAIAAPSLGRQAPAPMLNSPPMLVPSAPGFCRWGLIAATVSCCSSTTLPAYPAAIFGAIRAGLVPLLINTLTPPDLLQFYLADSRASIAICDSAFVERFNGEACRDTKLGAVVVTNGDAPRPVQCARCQAPSGWRGRQASWRRPIRIAMTWRSGCTPRARPAGRRGRAPAARHALHAPRLWPRHSEPRRKRRHASRRPRSSSPTASATR